jgi:hypothetical protein
MRNFLFGVLFGIVIATVGFSGIVVKLDHVVNKIKEIAVDQTK